MFRNVIFDLDGTLVDSLPGIEWSVDEALSACGLPARSRDLRALIGPTIRDILATVSGVADAGTLDRLVAAYRSSYDSLGWRKTMLQPGAREVIERLHTAGCDLWVVTNKPGFASRLILTELGLMGFFGEVVSRDSSTPPFATKEQTLVNLLERRKLKSTESIMVGDTLEDCRAAAGAGIECAVVAHGYGGGLDGPLPERCRLIDRWDELLE